MDVTVLTNDSGEVVSVYFDYGKADQERQKKSKERNETWNCEVHEVIQ